MNDVMNVLEDFEWEEAAQMFKQMRWEWYSGIPNAQMLKEKARDMVERCIKHQHTYLSSGRITVMVDGDIVEILVGMNIDGPVSALSDILMDSVLE